MDILNNTNNQKSPNKKKRKSLDNLISDKNQQKFESLTTNLHEDSASFKNKLKTIFYENSKEFKMTANINDENQHYSNFSSYGSDDIE